MSLYDKFICKAKARIALRHLTLTEVGAAIGLSTAQVSRVLNGAFRIKGDNLLRMAMILEISLDEIIFPEKEQSVPSPWISVKDRLPDGKREFGEGEYVLATDGVVTTRAFYGYPGGHDEWFIDAGEQWEAVFDRPVTHWMPLPEIGDAK